MEANATCTACGAPLQCEPAGDCWCKQAPVRLPLPPPGDPAGCYCPACLKAKADQARAAAAQEAEAARP